MAAVRIPPEDVEFPVVVLGSAVLASLRVERLSSLDRSERFAAGHDRAEALDVLMDARAKDPEERRLDGVLIRFMRKDFSGPSYGLALALADKRARFPPPERVRVIATGQILPGGDGGVGSIEGFAQKAQTVLEACEAAAAPIVFAFPKENWREASDEVRAGLEAAQEAGKLRLRPAAHLDALDDLWDAPQGGARARSLRPSAALAAVAVGVLGALSLGGFAVWRQIEGPMRDCEAALTILDADATRNDASLIATAATKCKAAADARPEDGRLQFLAGQALALNSTGSGLADKYWRRAAEKGDKDGLATWGRHLWLSDQDNRATVALALDYLSRAADKGSPAALEDMAEIYQDGRAVPPNLAMAEQLLARARAMRKEDSR